ncbi:MAG: hypothetical protein AB8G99_19725 [Planctomycetaceae bacterium]
MDANSIFNLLTWKLAVPAATTVVALLMLKRIVADRYSYSIALAAGLLAGSLHDWASFFPQRHYQWIPWLPILVLIPLGLSLAEKVHHAERIAALLFASVVAAWFITPTWSRLDDTRTALVVSLAVGTWGLCCVVELLANRLSSRWFLTLMTVSLTALAGIVMLFMSGRFGEIPLCGAGAFAGITLLSLRANNRIASQAAGPLGAILLSTAAFISFIEPDPPNYVFLLPLAAPITLLPFVVGPLRDRQTKKLCIAQLILFLAIFGATAAWLQLSVDPTASQY